MEVDSNDGKGDDEISTESALRAQLFDHIAGQDNVHFKSQQIGEPELSSGDKRAIVEEIWNRNVGTFLARFGSYMLPEHVSVIENHPSSDSYEVQFYLNKLKNQQYKPVSKVQIKNRRFEAMKRLMSEGEYFSVSEMRKRNPLLFDQLLGKFLQSPESESKVNDPNLPIAHILLDQIEQDQVAALKQSQIEAEMKQAEEYPVSDDEFPEGSCNFSFGDPIKPEKVDDVLWGKSYKSNHVIAKSRWRNERKLPNKICEESDTLTQEEKLLLINEFTSSMFNSFLQGNDAEFDYNNVDNNPEYDDVNQCDVDEEEKYFDSEIPEDVEMDPKTTEDDEFDKFMKEIEHEVTSEDLAESLKKLDSNDSRC